MAQQLVPPLAALAQTADPAAQSQATTPVATTAPAQAVTPPTSPTGAPTDGSVAPQLAAMAASPDPAVKAKAEEMITLYHISNNPGWATEIATGKGAKTDFDKLRRPISPTVSSRLRTEKDPYGDGRGGDDLGPGFYTGDSRAFVDKYAANYDKNNPASVLQFTLPKSALDALRVKSIAGDDDATFQQYMKDGFATYDTASKKTSLPKLDGQTPTHDLLRGPINDIEAAGKMKPRLEGTTQSSVGSILKLGDETPLQYNWATKEGVEALYSKSTSITATNMAAWQKAK
jgi:hypothetical protein